MKLISLFISLTIFIIVKGKINNENIENELKNQGSSPTSKVLFKDPKCHKDLKRLCSEKGEELDDLDVLSCVQNFQRDDSALLSNECHHVIWAFKQEITQDQEVDKFLKDICKSNLDIVDRCSKSTEGHIRCMLDRLEQLDKPCQELVIQMGIVLFSDYHLIKPLVEHCKADIEKYSCGRVEPVDGSASHSQGLTIECLEKHVNDLMPKCQHEIVAIAKIQAKDVQLDRALYFACQNDQERLCPRSRSGKVAFSCLLKKRNDERMSDACHEQIERRIYLTLVDYEVSKSLSQACGTAIHENHCDGSTTGDEPEVQLTKVITCLEGVRHDKGKLPGECLDKLTEYRTIMMEIAPPLIEGCKSEIREFCSQVPGTGKVHCLMKHIGRTEKDQVSKQCLRALEQLIELSDPSEDWRVDPVLHEVCMPVVQEACADTLSGKGRVFSCLLHHIDKKVMNMGCRRALLEIQYFVSRNWKLRPQLYESCRSDAAKICHAGHDWFQDTAQGPRADVLVLPCLFRYAFNESQKHMLKPECAEQVHIVMVERSSLAELNPQVERECLRPLSTICAGDTSPGAEMECLKKNYDELDSAEDRSCKSWIKSFIIASQKDVNLNNPIVTNCMGIIKQTCVHLLNDPKGAEEEDVMDCLIKQKNTPLMSENPMCRVAVENYQLLMMKDMDFSPRFQKSCQGDFDKFCSSSKNLKEALDCLAQRLLHDTLTKEKTMSQPCKAQLRHRLAERHETVALDPDLNVACKSDMESLCSSVKPGSGRMLGCLRSQITYLTPECHKVVFRREQVEVVAPMTDVALMRKCKSMYKMYCSEEELVQIFPCLVSYMNEPQFDVECKKIVELRMVERSKDIRLSPVVYRECREDAEKYCPTEMHMDSPKERNGLVMECLRKELLRKRLSNSCATKVLNKFAQQGLDYRLNPTMLNKCGTDMSNLCFAVKSAHDGSMEECLKKNFKLDKILDPNCKNYIAELIQEERADIHADPLLYKVCRADDVKYCSGLQGGEHWSCLFSLLEKDASELNEKCRERLIERKNMFEMALKVSKLETLKETVEDLVVQVKKSPQRNYLLAILCTLVGLVLILGIMCGRISKRKYHLLKNR